MAATPGANPHSGTTLAVLGPRRRAGARMAMCQRVMTTLRAFVSAARAKVS
jgi:hypothetical protein